MREVVVVGAGLGGLSAAIALASRGLQVTVVEALGGPGGKAGVVTLPGGVEADTGPSLFTLPAVLRGVFELAGARLEDEVTLFQHAPSFRYLYPDGVRLDVHPLMEDTLASVSRTLGADAARDLREFLAYARRIWESAAPHFVFGPAPSLRGVATLGLPGWLAVGKIDAMRTMLGAIESRVRSPHLRDLLCRYATYNGSDPRRAPATLNCVVWAEQGLGAFGVEGGLQAVVRALVRVAARLGVQMRFDAPVARLLVEAGRASGVVLRNGEVLRAQAVVANADVAHVFTDLLPAAAHRDATASVPSMSGWTALVRARRQAERAPHTVLFPRRYMDEFRDIFDRDAPPAEPTVYICAQERAHRRAGWPDHEALFLMANTPAEPASGMRDPAIWSALRERVLARARDAGLLAGDDVIVWERTPTQLASTFPRTRGALYGAASNGALSAFRRPANRVRGVRGLYLASGSAHPGGGVPLCLQSGRAAADALLQDLGETDAGA